MSTTVYQLGGGGSVGVSGPTIISPRDPVATDVVSPNGGAYLVGQLWKNFTSGSVFEFLGSATWVETSQGAGGPITTLTGTTGTANPAGGNIQIAGTANQITTAGAGSAITLTLPVAITAPGSLTTTTSLAATTTVTAGTGITSTTGNIVATAGAVSAGTTVTGGTGVVATTGNVAATAGAVTAGTTMTAGTGITSTTGNIVATAGAVNAGTSMTATLGNITTTNGNFVASTAGTGLVLPVGTASGATPQVVDARVGSVTFTTISIAAAADSTLVLTNSTITGASTRVMLSMIGATTGSALSIKSVTPSAGSLSIVVTNGTGATTTTADITFDFIVLN